MAYARAWRTVIGPYADETPRQLCLVTLMPRTAVGKGGAAAPGPRDGGLGDVARQISDHEQRQARKDAVMAARQLAGRQKRGVFEVDARPSAALELAWANGSYHGFSADGGLWSAISNAGDVLTGDTPDALTQKIRAHWQAME
jgi:hypothetical protein